MRLLFSILIFVACLYVPAANADDCTSPTCDQGTAYSKCMAALQYSLTWPQGATVNRGCVPEGVGTTQDKFYDCVVNRTGHPYGGCFLPGTTTGQQRFFWGTSCEALEHMEPGLIIFDGTSKSEVCSNGCMFKRPNDSGGNEYDIEGFARTIGEVGGWVPTGAVCANFDTPPKKEPQCITGGGQTFCIKPDGEKCATASNGKTFCWGKGDNGDKTDANQYGTNSDNGPRPPTNPPKPPDNTDWKPPVNCTTVHERSGNGYSSITRTICTGTSTGNPNPPQCNPTTDPNCRPPTQNSQCDPKTDPNRCQGGTASGGHGCEAPPTCSGDPIGCAILNQSWRQRCSPNGNKAKGGSCNADGSAVAIDCSGDEIACRQTQTAHEMKCKAQAESNALRLDAGQGIDDSEEPGDFFIEPPAGGPGSLFNTNLISMGGGNLLPSITLAGQTWQPPPILYDILAAIRWLVIAGCTVFAMRIRVGL